MWDNVARLSLNGTASGSPCGSHKARRPRTKSLILTLFAQRPSHKAQPEFVVWPTSKDLQELTLSSEYLRQAANPKSGTLQTLAPRTPPHFGLFEAGGHRWSASKVSAISRQLGQKPGPASLRVEGGSSDNLDKNLGRLRRYRRSIGRLGATPALPLDRLPRIPHTTREPQSDVSPQSAAAIPRPLCSGRGLAPERAEDVRHIAAPRAPVRPLSGPDGCGRRPRRWRTRGRCSRRTSARAAPPWTQPSARRRRSARRLRWRQGLKVAPTKWGLRPRGLCSLFGLRRPTRACAVRITRADPEHICRAHGRNSKRAAIG